MRAEPICSWLPDAMRDLEVLAESRAPALKRRLRPAISRMPPMNGPFIRLIDAIARDLGLVGDARTALIGRATVMLHLYVRLQEDLVDDEALVDRATVYAMEAVLSCHIELFAHARVPADAMVMRSELMTRFAAYSAREVDGRERLPSADAARAGEKFLPMAVPLVALASLAGRVRIYDTLAELVIEIGTALHMVKQVDVARAAIGRALDRARALELPRVASVVSGVSATIDAAQQRVTHALSG